MEYQPEHRERRTSMRCNADRRNKTSRSKGIKTDEEKV
jgi:hypothetical protein